MNVLLHSVFPEAVAGAEPPTWLHLVPAGTFSGQDGRGPYHLTDAAAVIALSMKGGAIPVDENHATDHAMKTGQPSPARGWIREMQARDDGIYGRVEWTPSGVQLMSEKAYRGVSPVLAVHEKSGAVLRVLRAALTNTPNLGDIKTLHSTQEAEMNLVAMRAALGLPETADEAAILAAVQANATAVASHSQSTTALVQRIAAAAGASATDADGLVTVLNSQRAAAGDATKMAGQIIELQTQLGQLQGQKAKDAATVFVDAAIRAGKPITPLRDHFIARHSADPVAVEKEINGLPSIHSGGLSGDQLVVLHAAGGGDGDDWTATDKMTCEKMGISKEKFLAQRKKAKAAKETV